MAESNNKGKGTCKVLDFSQAYAKRNGGKTPTPLPQIGPRTPYGRPTLVSEAIRSADVLIDLMDRLPGCRGRKIIEIDLDEEKEFKRDILRPVRALDSILAKAGWSYAEIVFARVDGFDRLVCILFKEERWEYINEVAVNGTIRLWSGMRRDNHAFTLELQRLPVYHQEDGMLANIVLFVNISEEPIF